MRPCQGCKSYLGTRVMIEGRPYASGYHVPMCTHPDLRNSKTGEYQSCHKMRMTICGEEAEYYEARRIDTRISHGVKSE